jgi:hypothetical protein
MFRVNQEPIEPQIRRHFHRIKVGGTDPASNRRLAALNKALQSVAHSRRLSRNSQPPIRTHLARASGERVGKAARRNDIPSLKLALNAIRGSSARNVIDVRLIWLHVGRPGNAT